MAVKRAGKTTPSVSPKAKKKRPRKVKVAEKVTDTSQREVGLHATAEILTGAYCNVAQVKHTHREFILDFVLGVDNHNALVSRVITSPAHAKELANVLAGNIAQYEKSYGEIETRNGRKGATH